jgi:hypothetical protein
MTEKGMIRPLVAIAMLLAAAAPVAAQKAPPPALGEAAKAVLGTWEFSNADRDKICTVTFRNTPAAIGFRVEFDANCHNLFPLVADISGWIFRDQDLLRLVDANGRSLVEFSEVEDGIYEAPTPGVGLLFLQNPATTEAKRPDQVAGEWTLRRGSQPVCTIALMTDAAGDGFALRLKPGCDATIARLNFTRWRLDRDELLLAVARGDPWRFEEVDDTTWRRLPESTGHFTLTRQ